MKVEVVPDEHNTSPSQRRPNGHLRSGATKKGNKKRGLRARSTSLIDEEEGLEDDQEEDDKPLSDDLPPGLLVSCCLHAIRDTMCERDDDRVKLGDCRKPD